MSIATLSGNMTNTDIFVDKECAQIEDKRAAVTVAGVEPSPDPSVRAPSPVPDTPIPALLECEKNGSPVDNKHSVEFISDPPANRHAGANGSNGANGTTAEEGKHEEGAKNGCPSSESVCTGFETNGKDTETKSNKNCQGEGPVDVQADDKGDLCENREVTACAGKNGTKCQRNPECVADCKDRKGNLNGVPGQSNPEGQSNQHCGAEPQDRSGEVHGAETKIPLDKDVAVDTEGTHDAKHEENTDEAKALGGENNQTCEQYNKESEISNNEIQTESTRNMSIDNDGDSGAAIDSAEKVSTPTITITEAEPAKEEEDDKVQAMKSVAESKPEESAAEAKPDDAIPPSKVGESSADSKSDAE